MALRRSYTAIVERNVEWLGEFATEPYEAAWASEAIFFVRALDISEGFDGAEARVQISADGIRWIGRRHGVSTLPAAKGRGRVLQGELTSAAGCRLRGAVGPSQGDRITVLVSLVLKE